MGYETIVFDRKDSVATLTLSRPDKLNALTVQMWSEIDSALESIKADDEVRVLVITGAGRGFCSGTDLSTRGGGPLPPLVPMGWFGEVTTKLAGLDRPVICAVNGVAAGAGFSLTLACDIRIAAESARFSSIFIRRALIPDAGASCFLPSIVGSSQACELMFTGDIIDAKEAERIGLVSRVVPDDKLLSVVGELATRIAKGPPIAMRLTKRAIFLRRAEALRETLEYEAYAQAMCQQSDDAKEGITAFLEKREPVFTGRRLNR